MSNKTEARIKLNTFLSQFKFDQVTSFNCLGCGNSIGTLIPSPESSPFDSAVSCPDCNKSMFKIVHHNGAVSVHAI